MIPKTGYLRTSLKSIHFQPDSSGMRKSDRWREVGGRDTEKEDIHYQNLEWRGSTTGDSTDKDNKGIL